jgi:hypothetical protein
MGKDVTIVVPDAAKAEGGQGKQPLSTHDPIVCPRCKYDGMPGMQWRQDIYQLWFFCSNCGLYLKPVRGK